MPTKKEHRFTFICGPDDYLVGREGRERFEAMIEGVDEFSRESMSGFTSNVGDVEVVIKRFREAVQTLGLFGGRRAIWLKDMNFLADSVTGRAEGTLALVEDMKELLESVEPAELSLLITASPVDRRRSFPKWCEANGDFQLVGDQGKGGGGISWDRLADGECERWNVSITRDAVELLVGKTGGNARLFTGEIQKLSTFLGEDGATIEERHVEELVPAFGEGDFFETAEAFFSRNLEWTLEAVRRHFFAGNDARPLIASLQNRNRLLIQLNALSMGGAVSIGSRGVNKSNLESAAHKYAELYGDAASEKSAFNVFTQNPWYLGKLIGNAKLPPLRKLIDHQLDFARAFEQMIERPNEQEEVIRAMVIRCLA